MRPLHVAVFAVGSLLASTASAEFPALETALAQIARTAGDQIADRSAHVAVRNVTGLQPPWRVAEAIQIELVAALLKQKRAVQAAGHDERLTFLLTSTDPFRVSDINRVQRFYEEGLVLVGELQSVRGTPRLQLTLYDLSDASSIWSGQQDLQPSDLAVEPNTPPLNRKVVDDATSKLGSVVGNRSSWALAAEALKAAGGKRGGIYDFGRTLGPLDPILPGDILQLEGVRFHENRGKRRSAMSHHTVVVEKVTSPTQLEVLHQAFNDPEVSRYTLKLDELREGLVIPYRPASAPGVLPEAFPLRKHAAEPAMLADGSLNLLRMIDPQLDCVHGVWHAFDGPLKCVRDSYSKLQIPCDLPDSYTLQLRVRREAQDDMFGIGLVVGGRQTLLLIDAYGGETTGLHRLDGQRARDNETARKLRVLPSEEWVDLECRVTPGSVHLSANGKSVLEWSGDASRLSMDPGWTVPNESWLFLAAHQNVFSISRLMLSTDQ